MNDTYAQKRSKRKKYFLKTRVTAEIDTQSLIYSDDNNENTKDSNVLMNFLFKSKIKPRYLKKSSFTAQGLAHNDFEDQNKSKIFLQEAYWEKELDSWQFKIGFQVFQFSQLEFFHPMDRLNSRHLILSENDFPKIGEPAVSINYLFGESNLSIHYMPFKIAPVFSSSKDRSSLVRQLVGAPIWVDELGNTVEDKGEAQGAINYETTIGNFELSLLYLNHFDRFYPVWIPDLSSGSIRPIYIPVQKFGFSGVYISDNYILKTEVMSLDFPDSISSNFGTLERLDQVQTAIGIEYTTVFSGGWTGTLFIEGQSVSGLKDSEAAIELYQNDAFFAYRLEFNDASSQELRFSGVKDLDRVNESLYGIEYSRRIGSKWRLKISARMVDAPLEESVIPTGLQSLHNEKSYIFNIKRYL